MRSPAPVRPRWREASPRRGFAFAVVCLLAVPLALFAQSGDQAGEIQRELPAHIKAPPAPTLLAEDALETFRVAPGFRIEIVASDPLVHDPVAMAFGPDGRLWVVEMRGFMPDADGHGEEAKVGSIAVLEDTDGDGRMDKRTTFLDGLVMPRALALVGDGVLVAEPPHLWFCRDRDGDGVADDRTEVAADYGGTDNPEHTANGLMWALDNWIYSANHTVRFRFAGDGRFISESTPARGQWGITQDDTGRIYFNSNSDPLRADLVPSAYLRRNPSLLHAAGDNVQFAPATLPVWPGRVTPGVNRGYKTLNREGQITEVTAACGPVIYRGTWFPAEFAGNAFICEPAGNLVKRIVLTERDGIITGRNAYEGTEFLTSTDERFRPVNLANGPDGALYLVDMYRGIIQHRIYMTSFLRKQVEARGLAEGVGMGRIYRIVPEGAVRSHRTFNLAAESSPQLVAHLRSADGWWRDTAQRLLVERRDPAATPGLCDLVRSGPPLAAVHALWTLDGCDQLDRATVEAALGRADERVIAAALRLAEKGLAQGDPEILRRVLAVDTTASPTLTLQAALSLGAAASPEAIEALAALAGRAGRQPYVADAIASGLAGRELDFIRRVCAHPAADNAAPAVTLAASAVLTSGDAERIRAVLAGLEGPAEFPAWGRAAVLAGVERFLPKTPDGRPLPGTIPVEPVSLLRLAARGGAPESEQAVRLAGLLTWPGKPGLAKAVVVAELSPVEKQRFEKGREVFTTLCAACHQRTGEGLAGLAPPLIHSRYVLGADRVAARIVLNGKEGSGMTMPPLRSLDDESIAAVLTYVRRSWGHAAAPVSPATIAEVRREVGNREEPWSEAELQAISASAP